MIDPGFAEISAEALKTYLAGRREEEFLLVDVRQPAEYDAGHLPGSFFLPLPELESRIFDLPTDRELIFYCRSGARSAAAASLATEAEVTAKKVYSLAGGILGWQGHTLAGFPKIHVFDGKRRLVDLLYTAMDLEKGAWRFYRYLLDHLSDLPIADTIESLSKAETAHARLVYRFWKPSAASPEPFDTLFEQLPGEILEGGEPLADVLQRVEQAGNHPCLHLVELALTIEYAAYDLYRNMAERSETAEARDALLSIAQAERAHMRSLVRAIEQCPTP